VSVDRCLEITWNRAILNGTLEGQKRTMSTLDEIALYAFLVAFFVLFIAAFMKGSRPPQPLETEPPTTTLPSANAVAALLSPGVSILVFYLGVWIHFINNRIFDALICLPLICGTYFGRRAFQSKMAHMPVRVIGLLAVIVCMPFAILFLVMTIFGIG
jgi:hypothetical protein